MVGILATCSNPLCGAVFEFGERAISLDSSSRLHLSGCSTTCPICKQKAEILDAVYTGMGDTLRLLSGPETTLAILRLVQTVLKAPERQGEDEESVLRAVSEVDQKVSDILRRVDRAPGNVDWLGRLIGVVGLAISVHSGYFHVEDATSPLKPPVQQEQRIDDEFYKPPAYQREGPKIKRNDPCPCKSGKKYKKCCGKLRMA